MINLYSIWNTVMNKQKCIGKTKVLGAFVMLFGFGVAFAQDMIIEPNTDRPGNDYAIFEIEPSPPGSFYGPEIGCHTACAKDSKCVAWTFVKSSVQGGNGICRLKDSVSAPKENDCCISGFLYY